MDRNTFTKKQEDSLKGHCNNSGQKSGRPNDAEQGRKRRNRHEMAKMPRISKDLHEQERKKLDEGSEPR